MKPKVSKTAWVVIASLATVLTSNGYAEDFFDPGQRDEIEIKVDGTRTKKQKILIASLFSTGVVFAGAGGLLHYASSTNSDAVSANGTMPSGRVYTADIDRKRSRALLYRDLSIGAYVIGGAAITAGIVAISMTQPESQVEIKHGPTTSVALSPDGAYVSRTWSF